MAVELRPLGVGLALHADWEYLETVQPLLPEIDFIEVSPEGMWGVPPDGTLRFNGFADAIEDLAREHGLPIGAHGLGLSPGTISRHPADIAAEARWLEMIERAQKRFDFAWYLDHLGFSRHSGCMAMLPLPIAYDEASIGAVARCMNALRRINPFVGYENAVWYFTLGPVADAPQFLSRLVKSSQAWLLLDAHNVYTDCVNAGLDWRTYVDGLPLDRVLCMHVSGGTESDPEWLLSKRVLRLDSHDAAVPEAVWEILDYCARRAPNLRGIVLERLENTFDDVAEIRNELDRVRALWDSLQVRPTIEPLPPAAPAETIDEQAASLQRRIAESMHDADPAKEPGTDADGVQISSLLVQKLRFERLMRGDADVSEIFERDPPEFVREFERYRKDVPPTAFFPAEEARAWRAWRARGYPR